MNWARALPILLLASPLSFAAAEKQSAAAVSNTALSISQNVRDQLTLTVRILNILDREFILCLAGEQNGGQIHITEVLPPRYQFSSPDSVGMIRGAEPCAPRALAWWHNHPRGICALSPQDIQSALEFKIPYVLVQTDEKEWCWWTLEEVKRLTENGKRKEKLYPLPGRHIFRDRSH